MASEIGDIAGDADEQRGLAPHLQLRLGTGLLLLVAALAVFTAWAWSAVGDVVEAKFAWRVAFFGVVAAVVLNIPILAPVWRGLVHFSAGLKRAVPFAPSEFSGTGALNPQLGRNGVTGRPALAGAGIVVLGVLLWLGVLAFSPLSASGTVTLRAGQSTSDVRPVGLRVGDLAWGKALPHQHTFLGLAENGSGTAVLQALDPRSGDSGEYALGPGQPVLLGPHRVFLESASFGPPNDALRVEVTGVDGAANTVVLRRGVATQVGGGRLELLELREQVFDAPITGARVRVTGLEAGAEPREIWLLPDNPEIDARHGTADAATITPLGLVGQASVVLRFTERWVLTWRVVVLVLVGVGAFLLLLVPHRSWVWTGRPGDLELRAWSINGNANLEPWSTQALRTALGESGFAELEAIEKELSSGSEAASGATGSSS